MTEKKLLRSLREHKVKFVVIGAWAFPAHGYNRYTGDIDIFIKPTRQNAVRTMQALQAVGYDVVRDASVSIFLRTKVLIRNYSVETDIHPFVKGVTFDELWKNRVETEIEGEKVFVPSLDDVIKMKVAAGRDKDKFDLIELRKIQRHLKKRQAKP